jgi:hypothetical protein
MTPAAIKPHTTYRLAVLSDIAFFPSPAITRNAASMEVLSKAINAGSEIDVLKFP